MTKKAPLVRASSLSPASIGEHTAEFSTTVSGLKIASSLNGSPENVIADVTNERRKYAARGVQDLLTILAKNEQIEAAEIDFLTRLPLRAVYERQIRRVADREAGKENPTAILTIADINGLKRVNTAKGHKMGGDRLIAATAHVISSTLRPGDIACRIGGDEFAILRQAGPENLENLDERLNVAFNASKEIRALHLGPELYTGITTGNQRFELGFDAESWHLAADLAEMTNKAAFNASLPSGVLAQDPRILLPS